MGWTEGGKEGGGERGGRGRVQGDGGRGTRGGREIRREGVREQGDGERVM